MNISGENKMEIERNVAKWGTSLVVVIPPDVVKYLDLEQGTDIVIDAEKGKHGKFISIWRKDQKEDKK